MLTKDCDTDCLPALIPFRVWPFNVSMRPCPTPSERQIPASKPSEAHAFSQQEETLQERSGVSCTPALQALADGQHQPRQVKDYAMIWVRSGRISQRFARVAHHYTIQLEKDEATGRASALHWQRRVTIDDLLPGVYCLRTDRTDWDVATIWQTNTLLTEIEAVFRSLRGCLETPRLRLALRRPPMCL